MAAQLSNHRASIEDSTAGRNRRITQRHPHPARHPHANVRHPDNIRKWKMYG
jgi:hypothetical protein